MANEIHRGEKIAFSGTLTESGQTTTDFTLACQLFQSSMLVREIPCSIDETNDTYYGVIDTADLVGPVGIRFVAKTAGGDIIVSNGTIQKTILP